MESRKPSSNNVTNENMRILENELSFGTSLAMFGRLEAEKNCTTQTICPFAHLHIDFVFKCVIALQYINGYLKHLRLCTLSPNPINYLYMHIYIFIYYMLIDIELMCIDYV